MIERKCAFKTGGWANKDLRVQDSRNLCLLKTRRLCLSQKELNMSYLKKITFTNKSYAEIGTYLLSLLVCVIIFYLKRSQLFKDRLVVFFKIAVCLMPNWQRFHKEAAAVFIISFSWKNGDVRSSTLAMVMASWHQPFTSFFKALIFLSSPISLIICNAVACDSYKIPAVILKQIKND